MENIGRQQTDSPGILCILLNLTVNNFETLFCFWKFPKQFLDGIFRFVIGYFGFKFFLHFDQTARLRMWHLFNVCLFFKFLFEEERGEKKWLFVPEKMRSKIFDCLMQSAQKWMKFQLATLIDVINGKISLSLSEEIHLAFQRRTLHHVINQFKRKQK